MSISVKILYIFLKQRVLDIVFVTIRILEDIQVNTRGQTCFTSILSWTITISNVFPVT